MELSDLISAIALLVALGTTVWQIQRARFEKPIIDVFAYAVSIQTSDTPRWVTHAVVSNVGDRPVTLLRLQWAQTDGGTFRHAYSSSPQPESVKLPYRLEPFDSVPILMSFSNMPALKAKESLRAAALVVQRATWWEKKRGIGSQREIFSPKVRPESILTAASGVAHVPDLPAS